MWTVSRGGVGVGAGQRRKYAIKAVKGKNVSKEEFKVSVDTQ